MQKFLMMTLLGFVGLSAQTRWEIDKVHSNVMFTVRHLVISEVTGYFKSFDGTLTYTQSDFSDAEGKLSVDVNSIFTDNEKRDNHLRSEDFFHAEKYPSLTFVSTSFKKTGDYEYKIYGDLTMRGVTKAVELDAVFRGEVKDPWGNTKSGWKLTGVVNRHDYGLNWGPLMEAGGAVVGKDVTMTVQVELLKVVKDS